MTDIVKRLRRANDPCWTQTRAELVIEAADEIERLRKERDITERDLWKEIEWLRAENDSMKQAWLIGERCDRHR